MDFASRRLLACAAAFGVAGPVASATFQVLSERADRRRFPPPGRIVEVNGRRVHVWTEGEGSPTVVIVPGMSSPGIHWVHVQRALVPDHHVVLYDRAGVGWSQAAPWWEWRSPSRIADELHDTLTTAGEGGPFLFVGHSLGGEVVRLYANRHPDQVAGMVLVDAPSENNDWLVEEFGWWRYGPVRWWKDVARRLLTPRGLVRLRTRSGVDTSLHDKARRKVPPDLVETEMFTALTSGMRRADVMERVVLSTEVLRRERRHFGGMPLVVISASASPSSDSYACNPCWDATVSEFARRRAQVWARIQADLASLSYSSKLIVAERAGHNVQWDEPELIVDAVTDMCAALAADQE
ncbi:alpha/beta hydrolase [Actinomadura spongiicola]|uniref:alpha/beta hydrolase n=1 Tax=Actinomadura spongiicola TaxID=2303421 RepID=UPI0013140C49|nr:alpha/beta hydrolase [Actinomadura spongiicola]